MTGSLSIDSAWFLETPFWKAYQRGLESLRGGYLEAAEQAFIESHQLSLDAIGGFIGATLGLARVARKRGQMERAVALCESRLPSTEAIRLLVSLFREMAKKAEKGGDRGEAVALYDRELSIGWLLHNLLQLKPRNGVSWESEEQDVAYSRFMAELRSTPGGVYCYRYADHGSVPCRGILSDRDYRSMHRLNFGE